MPAGKKSESCCRWRTSAAWPTFKACSVLRKNQTGISQDIEEKILSMYAKGMTTSDIEAHIRDIYGVEVSDTDS